MLSLLGSMASVSLELTDDGPISCLKMCREAVWSPWGNQCAWVPYKVKPENELMWRGGGKREFLWERNWNSGMKVRWSCQELLRNTWYIISSEYVCKCVCVKDCECERKGKKDTNFNVNCLLSAFAFAKVAEFILEMWPFFSKMLEGD